MNRLAVIALACAAFCSGCSTITVITSAPDGADISLDGSRIGKTPFTCKVGSKFGIFNKYMFKAEKEGYKPELLIFQEPSYFSGASGAVPDTIHFDLKPEKPAVPEEEKPGGK